MAEDELTTLHITSAHFKGRDRIEAFREIYGRQIMKLEIEPSADHPFELDFVVRGFRGLGIASGRLSPTINTHTTEMIEDDDVVLVFASQGCGTLNQIGRETTIEDGQATLISNGSTGIFRGNVPSHLVNFRLSRALLSSLGVDTNSALVQPIAQNNPALRLMVGYAGILNDTDAMSTPELRHSVALHMHDLAALALGAGRESSEVAKKRGVRMARLHAIKDDIAANLSQQNLSAETLAVRHGITPRYVNMLFETEGLAFSKFVLSQRLARAHRMLVDPKLMSCSISAIAYSVGFSDLSYFNRTFRRRYGATPSDIRAAAR